MPKVSYPDRTRDNLPVLLSVGTVAILAIGVATYSFRWSLGALIVQASVSPYIVKRTSRTRLALVLLGFAAVEIAFCYVLGPRAPYPHTHQGARTSEP